MSTTKPQSHILWYQGANKYTPVKCDGKPVFSCPKSRRIAAEYMRDMFTLTNVLNPNTMYDDLGVESWLKRDLQDVKVGDYLWLILVPPQHRVLDTFIANETTLTEHSSLQTMGGITLSLVTGEFKAANADGNCEMANENTIGTIIMPDTPDAKPQFLLEPMDVTTNSDTWLGVGVKVEALPNGKTLADIVGKIAVGAHVFGCDSQTYM